MIRGICVQVPYYNIELLLFVSVRESFSLENLVCSVFSRWWIMK